MKLLASLLGCAVADYACCPYDEFGVVNPHCPLTEKTPWAMKDTNTNSDPEGVSDHICKAWEANIDATMEGNEDGDNWGGCGFQRHFPWGIADAVDGGTTPGTPADLEHCRMGVFDCTAGTMVNKYKALKAGFAFPLSTGGFSAQGTNDVFGQVTLGGVCKLWIPVRLNAIASVSIAGVHMNGGGTDGDPGSFAVFDGAEVCDDATCSGNTQAGTAFCFSVVNIAEFMENNMPGSSFRVMNANVAGKDIGGGDPIRLEGNTFFEDFAVDFGQSIEPTNQNGGGGTIVDAGASFDVVVHFHSAWCIRHWTLVDMQTTPDVGSDTSPLDDYPLMDDVNDNPQHAHTDVADKRFDGAVGLCGCCEDTGTTRHDDPALLGNDPTAEGCHTCAGCTEINTYGAGVTDMDWPNAGAWAAYHSFITCSDNEFMIYHTATGIAGGSVTTTDNERIVVHSMFYNDVRHDYSNNMEGTGTIAIRGNIRQAGSTITNCGPGVIDTADNMRCTWNWNYVLNAGKDFEEWFNREGPQDFAVWKSGATVSRNDEANTHDDMISNIVETHSFTFSFQAFGTAAQGGDNGFDSDSLTHSMSMDASKYFSDPDASMAIDADEHEFIVTMHCLESQTDGNGPIIVAGDIGDDSTKNVRDIFPDCYMGDEIHFQYTIAGGTNANGDHRLSAWFSSVTATTF